MKKNTAIFVMFLFLYLASIGIVNDEQILNAEQKGKQMFSSSENQKDSMNPKAFKTDYGYMLFWEEVESVTDTDICYVKLNEKATPISRKIKLYNDIHKTFIIKVLQKNNKYHILTKKVIDENQPDSKGKGHFYYITVLDGETGSIEHREIFDNKLTKKFPTFVEPDLCFDGKHFVLIYAKKIPNVYLTSKLYLQKFDPDWNKSGDEIPLLLEDSEDYIKDIKFVDEDFSSYICCCSSFYEYEEAIRKAPICEDLFKVQPRIFYDNVNNRYDIFFRAIFYKSYYSALYYIRYDNTPPFSLSKPLLVSFNVKKVYDYRVLKEDTDKFFIVWDNYDAYFYKYISEEVSYTRATKKDEDYKTKYLSNIVKSRGSYLYARITDEFERNKLIMDRVSFEDMELAKDVRLTLFPEKPIKPYLVQYYVEHLPLSIYEDPIIEDVTVIFWSEDVEGVHQLHFRQIDY